MNTDGDRITGLDLKVRRIRALVKVVDLAAALGVSPSRVSRIESPDYLVTHNMERRYTKALETCRTSGTSAVA